MRKITFFILALTVVVSMASCGGRENRGELKVADEPATETVGTDGEVPRINIQIINGTSIGRLPPDPAILECPPAIQFSASAVNFSSPDNCNGYRNANSPLVQLSERQATAFISGLGCPAGCTRNQATVFKSWACGFDDNQPPPPTRNSAFGMAISQVTCTPN